MIRAFWAAALIFIFAASAHSQDAQLSPEVEPPMTLERMAAIIQVLDPEVQFGRSAMQFSIEGTDVLIVFSEPQDRMRAMVPIRTLDGIEPGELLRVLQANFDTALDARYAVGQGQLWAVFVHPLSSLEQNDLISGIGQTVNIAKTYGTLYSGGAGFFGLGDSIQEQRRLLESLLEKGEEI